MSLKHGLLGMLNYTDMTGYELMKAFNDSLAFFWQAQTSQIYRELNHMEEQGFLKSRIEVQTDKPNKRIYSITQAGRGELTNWLGSAMPDEMAPARNEVLLRLFFSSGRPEEETIASLRQIKAFYEKQLSQLRAISDTVEQYKAYTRNDKDALYWDLTADFGRAYDSMCLEWLERCIRRLEEVKG